MFQRQDSQEAIIKRHRETGVTMKRQNLVDKATDRQVRRDHYRGRHSVGHRGWVMDASHHAGGGSQEKYTYKDRPEPHEIGVKRRGQRHVKSKSDQDQGHQLAAEAGDAGRVPNAAASLPDNGAQNTAAIQRVTRKQIKDCEQEGAGADEKEKLRDQIAT